MTVQVGTILPLSSMANSNAARHFTYSTPDAKATVVASGYFDDYGPQLKVGDLIWVLGVNAGTEVFFVAMVDAISAAGVVTTLSSSLTLA